MERRRERERQVTLLSLSPPHCYNQSHAEKRRLGETGDFGVALSSTLLQSEPCRDEEGGRDRLTLVSLSPPHCDSQSHGEKKREGETGDFAVALSSTLLQSEPCREEERGRDR